VTIYNIFPTILIPQFNKYYTLLKFGVYISPSISIVYIIILLLKLSGLASLFTILIISRVAGTYIPVLKLLIDLVI
jgi:hypothetical protein